MGGRAEGPSYGRTWSKMAGGAHVAKWLICVIDYASRAPPALRTASFESRDIGIVNFGRSFLSRDTRPVSAHSFM